MEYVEFTKAMKKTHKILIPSMLPIHFKLIENILKQKGYKAEILYNSSRAVVDEGLSHVHNDTCYPATIVIGQMIDALKSGNYDVDHVALMITQTGGGCRASNYIHLLRKALIKAGFPQVPVISINFSKMEKNSGFSLKGMLLVRMAYAVLYGDIIMWIKNQCMPYEIHKGDVADVVNHWQEELSNQFASYRFLRINHNLKQLLSDFSNIAMVDATKTKVGIVGEIYMKYAPLGNNDLENYLMKEHAKVVLSPVLNFGLYCLSNVLKDYEYYGIKKYSQFIVKYVAKIIMMEQNKMIRIIKKDGNFAPFESYQEIYDNAEGMIDRGVKMGEGWLLTAEMVTLIKHGVQNIITCQPFGCLPNHIVARGMMRKIKKKYPNANIVAIDYDPGASIVNQENRIKLMLANAKLSKELQEIQHVLKNTEVVYESL